MKYSILLFLLMSIFRLTAQEEIFDYCMTFEFDTELSDIKEAAFQLPFMAGRSDNAPKEVKYYTFRINKPESKPVNSDARIITIKNVKEYSMESEIGGNEMAFFVCSFKPEAGTFDQFQPQIDLPNVLATFPSLNDVVVEETYIYLADKLILPGRFNTLTRGQMPEMHPGYYKLETVMIKQ